MNQRPFVIPAQAGFQFGANGGRASTPDGNEYHAGHGVVHFISTTMPGFYELLILAALIGLPLLFVAAIVFIVLRLTRK